MVEPDPLDELDDQGSVELLSLDDQLMELSSLLLLEALLWNMELTVFRSVSAVTQA